MSRSQLYSPTLRPQPQPVPLNAQPIIVEFVIAEIKCASPLNYTVEILAEQPDDPDVRMLSDELFAATTIPKLPGKGTSQTISSMVGPELTRLANSLDAQDDANVLAKTTALLYHNIESYLDFRHHDAPALSLNLVPTISSDGDGILMEITLLRGNSPDDAPLATSVRPGRINNHITLKSRRLYVVGAMTSNRSLGYKSLSGSKSVYIFIAATFPTNTSGQSSARLRQPGTWLTE